MRSVLRNFQHGKTRVDHPRFQFKYCEINGLKLSTPARAFSEAWKQIGGEKVGVEAAKKKLGAFFRAKHKDKGNINDHLVTLTSKENVVLLLDEIDMLRTKRNEVLLPFFDWPSMPDSRFILIAISNTLDLPEKISPKVSLSAALCRNETR